LSCARLGRRTVLVEKERLGGTGFRWGCLPVKMMLDRLRSRETTNEQASSLIPETNERIEQIEGRIRSRLNQAGVQVLIGQGRFRDPGTFQVGRRSIAADSIVIATGTEAASWPGIALDGQRVITHRGVLRLSRVPDHLLILGGDVEGIEFACIFSHLGGRVTVIEKERRILPGTDADLTEAVLQGLLDRGVTIRAGAEVRGCTAEGGATVTLRDGVQLKGDGVLVTGLRRPNLPEGLEQAGIGHDDQKIAVNADLQTSRPNIYAVGDINGITGMAHAAIQQGLLAARLITGSGAGSTRADRTFVNEASANPPYPRAIYTLPEIAGAGYQENELLTAGIPFTRRTYRLADTWRGFSKGIKEGFVKILSGRDDRVLGIWICGSNASEQASLFGPLMAGGLDLEGLRHDLILHPTLGEAFLDASLEI
jgi:dihydrolipoamide dehydrogenase